MTDSRQLVLEALKGAKTVLQCVILRKDGKGYYQYIQARDGTMVEATVTINTLNSAISALERDIAAKVEPEQYSRVVDQAWAQFCAGIGDGPNTPYPGMISAFESYYSQSFADKDWRNEAAVWAAAWKAAKSSNTAPQKAEAPGWMPIESAPKDKLILCADADNVCACTWQEAIDDGQDEMGCDEGYADILCQYFRPGRSIGLPKFQYEAIQPTHWMPLPSPPRSQP